MHLLHKCGPPYLKHGPGSFVDFWGMEVSSQVALGCLISGTNSTDVAEAIFHGPMICTSVPHYLIL